MPLQAKLRPLLLNNENASLASGWGEIAKNHQVRKKYTIQLGENELVLKELDLLNEDANVYKLIGPVLVKQDLAEANANVRKRIDYISAELLRVYRRKCKIYRPGKLKRNVLLKEFTRPGRPYCAISGLDLI
ncbi:Prefoldin beta-like [Dillenia turbinata]|uniref:Prefoldin beta-like n=1 Tax=Dillenia turbinata TaxID=194707 RepID=A0AAN8VM28_9MAGN